MTQPYPPRGPYPPPGQQWPPQQQPIEPKKKRRLWPWIVAAVVILLIAMSSIGSKSAPTTAAKAPAAAQPAAVAPAAKPAAPDNTVGDGTYQVGTDIPAGRYKTPGESAIGFCYWERSKDDSGDLGTIISNDLFKGPGSVTVKNGEFAKLSGGCTWTRQ